MNSALKLFYAPVLPFILHPERAYLLAGVFAILFVVSFARSRAFKLQHHVVMLLAVLALLLPQGIAGWFVARRRQRQQGERATRAAEMTS